MTASPRRLGAALLTTLAVVGGIATTAAPASATVTTLCTGYVGCAKLGMSSAGYSSASGTMYWRMYSGHNCTNYAAYRMVHAGMANSRPWTGGGNATNWGTAMSSITNATPRVGAVAWWKAGVYPAGSAGHVAYVEQVVSPDEIVVSMDSWHGDFSWARITRATRGWPSGFVHFTDARLTNTGAPTVIGTPKVGNKLTASSGTWSVSGATYAYQWLADGAAITGATTSTYTVPQAQTGRKLSVRVTATASGYPSTAAVSAPTAAVQPGVLTDTGTPAITGDPRVDSALTAQPGTWNPAPTALSYQWLADGTPIADATSATYTPDPAAVGKKLTARVTASRTGYAPVTVVTPATDPVALGRLTVTRSPSVSGAASPGSTLRLSAGAVDHAATMQVQWRRATVVVPGATGTTYRVAGADLGKPLGAVLRFDRPGYQQLVVATPFTPLVRTTPVVRLTTQPGVKRLSVRATVAGPGGPPVNGVIRVRSAGRLLGTLPVRAGVASGTLSGLTTGTRTFRFRIPMTSSTTRTVVVRRIAIH